MKNSHDRAGTSEGLLAVFMESRTALARFLVVRGAKPGETEDLLQDLYVKLAEGTAGPVAHPRAYLYRMANNLLLDRNRAAARRRRREEEWSGAETDAMPGKDTQPSIETILLDRERLEAVSNAVATLPERVIDIFRRFRLEGQAQKAIARDLDLSLSAVEKDLQRAYRAVLDARRQFDAGLVDPERLTMKGNHRDR